MTLAEQKSKIEELDRVDRWVLIGLAVFNSPISASRMSRLLSNAKIGLDKGRDWNKIRIESAFRRLLKNGMANKVRTEYRITSSWRSPAVFVARIEDRNVLFRLANKTFTIRGISKDEVSQRNYYYRINYEAYYDRAYLYWVQDDAAAFSQVVESLSEPGYGYYAYEKIRMQEKIDRFFWRFDTEFYLQSDPYFQELVLVQQLERYPLWEEETSQVLAEFLRQQSGKDGWDIRATKVMEQLSLMVVGQQNEPAVYESNELGIQVLNGLLKNRKEEVLTLYKDGVAFTNIVSALDLIHLIFLYGQQAIDSEELLANVSTFSESSLPVPVNVVIAYSLCENGQLTEGENILEEQYEEADHPLGWMFLLWVNHWLGLKPTDAQLFPLLESHKLESFQHVPWLQGEIYNALNLLFPGHPQQREWKAAADEIRRRLDIHYLVDLISPRAPWENALRIIGLVADDTQTVAAKKEKQLIWIVDFDEEEVYPKEQKMGKRGWTSGRKLKWSELIEYHWTEILETQDLQAIQGAYYNDRRVITGNGYSNDYITVKFSEVLYHLVGHPRIFLDDKKRIPLELKQGTPELTITEAESGLLLRFDPPMEGEGFVYKKETPTRYVIYQLSPEQARLARSIGTGIELPEEHRTKLEEKLEGIRNKVSVQSSTDLLDADLEEVSGDPKPCVQLLPFGDAFKLEIYVKPLPEETYYFKPGDGLPRTVLVNEEGRFICVRDLNEEETLALNLIEACPTLAGIEHHLYEWTLEDTQVALRVLLELRSLLEKGQITLEHPKGEKLKLVTQASSQDLNLSVNKNRDWFEVNGKVKVNENRVVDFEFLLEHLRNQESSFVQLANGEFMALTDELKDRLREMEGLLMKRGKKLQISTLAAGRFAEVADGLDDLEADEAWKDSLKRIKRAQSIRPKVPKNFRAELRDYQLIGYQWLMRLAEWGVGACLADDMGLGKTVQALAMLTARSAKGPSLVIAPASVTRNWLRETERFAPGLIPILVASRKDVDILQQIGPGDLVLVSYGLLPFIGEELQTVEFANIVLDEAQAIKNSATKRSKTVQQLQGDFKLATTGTPIENNLGELWSLFRFLNPGLLGSKEMFNSKYNRPITLYDDAERREQLRKLIKPFILRRRKEQVLKELPPKTEVVLNVALSEEEASLYEAMRRSAIKEISEADEKARRFIVLKELTLLRQAACHPKLVRPRSKVKSAKLELVGNTIREILDGGHKALVFSQFVKHLKIVEAWVKEQGIAYQYLDGSTPGKKREQSVNAFQAGEGELFLISLKAGGTGLNLTAADYVLHLDPWWNPAAEDQASDRAHRIGQQRPVTVYRFVSEATIEEKIIALHKDKRDLADQLLSGTSKANQLSVDQILDMIKEE